MVREGKGAAAARTEVKWTYEHYFFSDDLSIQAVGSRIHVLTQTENATEEIIHDLTAIVCMVSKAHAISPRASRLQPAMMLMDEALGAT